MGTGSSRDIAKKIVKQLKTYARVF